MSLRKIFISAFLFSLACNFSASCFLEGRYEYSGDWEFRELISADMIEFGVMLPAIEKIKKADEIADKVKLNADQKNNWDKIVAEMEKDEAILKKIQAKMDANKDKLDAFRKKRMEIYEREKSARSKYIESNNAPLKKERDDLRSKLAVLREKIEKIKTDGLKAKKALKDIASEVMAFELKEIDPLRGRIDSLIEKMGSFWDLFKRSEEGKKFKKEYIVLDLEEESALGGVKSKVMGVLKSRDENKNKLYKIYKAAGGGKKESAG